MARILGNHAIETIQFSLQHRLDHAPGITAEKILNVF